ncbi:proline-rich receptor-like protein kinase PERK2, partial [Copidosoma floridanum]|uniref:proline-rich receptor-like protein kinase PERK2 n=1 Tax=Copidosoma floridanum TaxID=29053 RepID=UPI000C6FBBB3
MRKLESYDGGLIVQPSHEREILAAVLEVKVDLKLEVQRVNQRLAKIEDMLQALLTRVPPPVQTTTIATSPLPSVTSPFSPPPQPSQQSSPQQATSRNLSAMVAAMSSPSGPTTPQSPVGSAPGQASVTTSPCQESKPTAVGPPPQATSSARERYVSPGYEYNMEVGA